MTIIISAEIRTREHIFSFLGFKLLQKMLLNWLETLNFYNSTMINIWLTKKKNFTLVRV